MVFVSPKVSEASYVIEHWLDSVTSTVMAYHGGHYKMQTADCRLQIAGCRLNLKCRPGLKFSHRLIRDVFTIYGLRGRYIACSLHFVSSQHFKPNLQSAVCTDWSPVALLVRALTFHRGSARRGFQLIHPR